MVPLEEAACKPAWLMVADKAARSGGRRGLSFGLCSDDASDCLVRRPLKSSKVG
jgi:hypothetical protein